MYCSIARALPPRRAPIISHQEQLCYCDPRAFLRKRNFSFGEEFLPPFALERWDLQGLAGAQQFAFNPEHEFAIWYIGGGWFGGGVRFTDLT